MSSNRSPRSTRRSTRQSTRQSNSNNGGGAAKKTSKKTTNTIDMEKLHKFSLRHYIYINAILGDKTLRQVISDEFPNEKCTLETEQGSGEFADSHHHVCMVKSKKGKSKKWCSVDVGIQDLDIHGHDTLCQSYSLLYYMGGINKKDKKLTRELQMRMIDMWRRILKNPTVRDQIQFSVRLKDKKTGDYVILPDRKIKYRNNPNRNKLIGEIRKVLKEWEDYGYIWFILKHTGNTTTKCKMCDQGIVDFSEEDIS